MLEHYSKDRALSEYFLISNNAQFRACPYWMILYYIAWIYRQIHYNGYNILSVYSHLLSCHCFRNIMSLFVVKKWSNKKQCLVKFLKIDVFAQTDNVYVEVVREYMYNGFHNKRRRNWSQKQNHLQKYYVWVVVVASMLRTISKVAAGIGAFFRSTKMWPSQRVKYKEKGGERGVLTLSGGIVEDKCKSMVL